MGEPDREILSFEEFTLDLGKAELRKRGVPVPVEPQVLDLITAFAQRPGTLLSRDDLIELVWGGRIVSDAAISSRISSARAVLGDDGNVQRVIRTVPRRGFRFEAEVREVSREPAGPVTDKPSIAVLPFQNLSGDPEQTYFSDGITDDIITELSRYSELQVTARHSSFFYRASDQPASAIARELGVQYLAEGSVRRAGNRVRITVQLIDPNSGSQIWAERFDREVTDIFEVQDDITTIVVNLLAGEISRQHYRRTLHGGTEGIAAYDHVLRATELALRVAPEENALARSEALAAIEADPKFARAHAILALTLINESNNFWTPVPREGLVKAHAAALAAVAADGRDPWAHAMLGAAELWLNRAHDRAIACIKRAVELNPSSSYFRGLYAYVLTFTGQPEKALEEIELAIRTNPRFPPVFYAFRGRALLILRRIDEAVPLLEEMIAEMPGHSNALGLAAVAYVAAGRIEEARGLVDRLVEGQPHYRLAALRESLPFRKEVDRTFILDSLEAAGLPE